MSRHYCCLVNILSYLPIYIYPVHCSLFFLPVLYYHLGSFSFRLKYFLKYFCSTCLLVLNSLSFCLSENAFSLFLRIFSPSWQTFLRTFKILASQVSAQKSATAPSMVTYFSLAIFRIFCLWFPAV